jgi:phosphoglucosamine mutase
LVKLFGSSGIRGSVNVDLTPILACKVGLAIAQFTKAKKALVGRDTRVSGDMLEDALVSGLLSMGVNVTLAGLIPTPSLAYLTKELEADVGCILTASHNPPQYNGIKLFKTNSLSFNEEDQSAVEGIIAKNNFQMPEWCEIGKVTSGDLNHRYVEMVKESVILSKNWRLVVDPGCGATFNVGPTTLKATGCQITTLNAQPDGFFPGRSSEPTKVSLSNLSHVVRDLKADVGVAFDGDGDRAAFIDESGNFINFDHVLAAFAAYSLKRTGGGTIITSVEASMCVEKMAEAFGGKVVRTKVGDVYISDAVKSYGSIFGGEPCGAWVHPLFHYCPDGVLSAVLLLKALEEEEKTLSEFVADVPKYLILRKQLTCDNTIKNRVLESLEKKVMSAFPEYSDCSDVDGVRLTLRNGWLLIRASGTEPLIRLTVEGESLKAAEDIMNKGIALVRKTTEELEK